MSVSAPARRAPFAEAVKHRKLANGARFFVLENHFNPTLAISGSLRAGRLYAPPERRMIASVTAGELLKGTERRTKMQLAEDLESRAVSLGLTSDASDPVGVDISGASLSRETKPCSCCTMDKQAITADCFCSAGNLATSFAKRAWVDSDKLIGRSRQTRCPSFR